MQANLDTLSCILGQGLAHRECTAIYQKKYRGTGWRAQDTRGTLQTRGALQRRPQDTGYPTLEGTPSVRMAPILIMLLVAKN